MTQYVRQTSKTGWQDVVTSCPITPRADDTFPISRHDRPMHPARLTILACRVTRGPNGRIVIEERL